MEDSLHSVLRRSGRIVGATAGAAVLGWLGYMAVTWTRYGRVSANGRRDPLLDRFLPAYRMGRVIRLKASDVDSLTIHANNRKIWMNLRDAFPHPEQPQRLAVRDFRIGNPHTVVGHHQPQGLAS